MHIKVGIRYKILNLTMHDGYSSYTGYTDLKTTFKDPLSNKWKNEIKNLIWSLP